MGILLCEQNFRDVWIRNESVRAEIGHILHTDTHTHTPAAKLVVRLPHMTSLKCDLSRDQAPLSYLYDLKQFPLPIG